MPFSLVHSFPLSPFLPRAFLKQPFVLATLHQQGLGRFELSVGLNDLGWFLDGLGRNERVEGLGSESAWVGDHLLALPLRLSVPFLSPVSRAVLLGITLCLFLSPSASLYDFE